MEDAPPKTLKTQLVHLDHNLKVAERTRFPGIQRAPGSLPVLEAFQDFLDKERNKSRKKLLTVTILSIVVMLLLTLGGGVFIYFRMKQSAVNYNALSDRAANLENILKENYVKSQSDFEKLGSVLQQSTAAQHQLFAINSNISARVKGDGQTVEELRATIAKLEAQNKKMQLQMLTIAKKWNSTALKIKKLTDAQKALSEHHDNMVDSKGSRAVEFQPQSIVQNRIKTDQEVQLPLEIQPLTSPPKAEAVPQPGKTRMDAPIPHGKIHTGMPRSSSSSIPIMIIPSGKSQGIRWRLPQIIQE